METDRKSSLAIMSAKHLENVQADMLELLLTVESLVELCSDLMEDDDVEEDFTYSYLDNSLQYAEDIFGKWINMEVEEMV